MITLNTHSKRLKKIVNLITVFEFAFIAIHFSWKTYRRIGELIGPLHHIGKQTFFFNLKYTEQSINFFILIIKQYMQHYNK
jgi:hypothetical protein